MNANHAYLDTLNTAQRAAAEYGTAGLPHDLPGPLLIIAGAGTGKTTTLAHRVAHLLVRGADPRRLLLLTFSRRAAEMMTRRAEAIVGQVTTGQMGARIAWSGTFHAVGHRLLRMYAKAVGLGDGFTVLDRSDAADLLNIVRHELGLSQLKARFPRKDTCLAIYSRVVNTGTSLERTLVEAFPVWAEWTEELKQLFRAYADEKHRRQVLDYDDLLLYWSQLVRDGVTVERVRRRFDHVLVDEYQDTNALQGAILRGLKPDGRGLTVVGDDAQSIYAFRGATVRNILDFPKQFTPAAHIITLEHNYRSVQPILDAANAVIAQAPEGYRKRLASERRSEQRPILATVRDEQDQADYIVDQVLLHREAGVDLKRQAVLMRASHDSALLEVELGRRRIPFVKYGGLKFLEAAHVKDVLGVLRWAENPHDAVAAFRVLQLLPGVGPATARRVLGQLESSPAGFGGVGKLPVPAATRVDWPALCTLLHTLSGKSPWHGQLAAVRRWYEPHLTRLHDAPRQRAADLEQLEQLAAGHRSRASFLSDVTLDPPAGLSDKTSGAAPDDDYLILSTIHSAKGQEWDMVYVLNAVDGCIPSARASENAEEIEEERRLFYVAMTRARDGLYMVHPHRLYRRWGADGDGHLCVPRTRFIPDALLSLFAPRTTDGTYLRGDAEDVRSDAGEVRARLQEMWA